MHIQNLAPWTITGLALALSAWSWTASHISTPVETVTPPTPAQVAPHLPLVASVSAPALDPSDLQAAVQAAVRAELAAAERPAPAPDPEVVEVMADVQDSALGLVDDFIEYGDVTEDDKRMLLDEISQLDQAHAEAVMTAYFDALNRGDIQVMGSPL